MNTESTHPNSQSDSHHQADTNASGDSKPKRVALPEPDPDNITVLTNKLPNKPILPWNRYDSPWKEEEEGEETETEATSEKETQQEAVEAVPEAETPAIQVETEVQTNGKIAESPESHLEESGDKGDLDEIDEVE